MADRRTGRDPDLYEVLGVHPEADAAELGRAYRRRLRELHPDTRPGHGRPADAAARGRDGYALARVREAYQVLRDPRRRAAYDAERAVRARRSPPPRDAGPYRADPARRPVDRRRGRSRVVIDLGIVRLRLDLDDLL